MFVGFSGTAAARRDARFSMAGITTGVRDALTRYTQPLRARTTSYRHSVAANRYGWLMETERARELLQAERARIERALKGVRREDDGELADQSAPANLATDLYQDELDEGFADDLHEQLAALERAEARLAAGTYGLSVESGDPIPDARLEVLPTAERTADEQRLYNGE